MRKQSDPVQEIRQGRTFDKIARIELDGQEQSPDDLDRMHREHFEKTYGPNNIIFHRGRRVCCIGRNYLEVYVTFP